MEAKRISPLKAIRLKCLDCCCGSAFEVRRCEVRRCPLWKFRMGRESLAEADSTADDLVGEKESGGLTHPEGGSP